MAPVQGWRGGVAGPLVWVLAPYGPLGGSRAAQRENQCRTLSSRPRHGVPATRAQGQAQTPGSRLFYLNQKMCSQESILYHYMACRDAGGGSLEQHLKAFE